MESFQFSAKMWRYSGKAAWYFFTLPEALGEEIGMITRYDRKGWGSVPVSVAIGDTTWTTSIFPDKKSHSYLLPVKAEVRKKESIKEDIETAITLSLINVSNVTNVTKGVRL